MDRCDPSSLGTVPLRRHGGIIVRRRRHAGPGRPVDGSVGGGVRQANLLRHPCGCPSSHSRPHPMTSTAPGSAKWSTTLARRCAPPWVRSLPSPTRGLLQGTRCGVPGVLRLRLAVPRAADGAATSAGGRGPSACTGSDRTGRRSDPAAHRRQLITPQGPTLTRATTAGTVRCPTPDDGHALATVFTQSEASEARLEC